MAQTAADWSSPLRAGALRPARRDPQPGRGPRAAAGRARAAARAASSCSAFTRAARSLTRTGWPSTSTTDLLRGPAASARRPSPAARASRSRPRGRRHTAPASAGSHSAWTVWAGRPFFITIGVTHASLAPAAEQAATVWASTSPVTSSTLAPARPSADPGSARARRPARRRRRRRRSRPGRRWPGPAGPTCRRRSRPVRDVIGGSGPHRAASAASRAAPVGVVSSTADVHARRRRCPPRRAGRATAGAGLGSTPCAARTVPRPTRDRAGAHLVDVRAARARRRCRRRRRWRRARRPRGSGPASAGTPWRPALGLGQRGEDGQGPGADPVGQVGVGQRAPGRRRSVAVVVGSSGASTTARVAPQAGPLDRPRRRAPAARPAAGRRGGAPRRGRRRRRAATPSAMSPAMPEKQWNQASARRRSAGSGPPGPLVAQAGDGAGRAEAVVDADDGDALRARDEHGQQRGDALRRPAP